ncbi:phage holin family protein [Bacillus sp. UNC438CL73TsuS30]|uniref:phage holin family protein n=1 Tax=Bacillus sp. UNC438CL73TsuS30 TaxID=1340434 RepID=UPI00047DDE70|nr:phage holin family protein [Bacillus sp. UNC438CL73TsuS30]
MNWEAFYKTGITVIGTFVGWLYGGWSPLLQVLTAFIIFDYASGLLASGVEGKLSSKVGFKGIAKKLMIFCMVAVGHLVDKAIGQGHLIGDSIIFFYLGNELLSIIENAGRTGLPVPDQIKNAIDILKGKGVDKQ